MQRMDACVSMFDIRIALCMPMLGGGGHSPDGRTPPPASSSIACGWLCLLPNGQYLHTSAPSAEHSHAVCSVQTDDTGSWLSSVPTFLQAWYDRVFEGTAVSIQVPTPPMMLPKPAYLHTHSFNNSIWPTLWVTANTAFHSRASCQRVDGETDLVQCASVF